MHPHSQDSEDFPSDRMILSLYGQMIFQHLMTHTKLAHVLQDKIPRKPLKFEKPWSS